MAKLTTPTTVTAMVTDAQMGMEARTDRNRFAQSGGRIGTWIETTLQVLAFLFGCHNLKSQICVAPVCGVVQSVVRHS